MSGYLLRPGEGVRPDDMATKATAASTKGALSLVESHVTAGAPRHKHHHDDEAFYVLDGVLTVRCGDETWEADRGCFVFLPRGVPHSWNVMTLSASLLIIGTPAGVDDYLREHHAAATEAEKLDVANRHGIEWC